MVYPRVCGGTLLPCLVWSWTLLPVYPRVCGGTVQEGERGREGGGLSPRVRGNHCVATGGPGIWGSIPACAGEPRNRTLVNSITAVYPRVCGGTRRQGFQLAVHRGLSPRVRGNLTSHTVKALASVGTVYPRVCGGTSLRLSHMVLRWPLGSIPACAGEPSGWARRRMATWVYPRVCGGTERVGPAPDGDMGLSPRVRGNPA